MKLTLMALMSLITFLPNSSFACSPAYLAKEDVINAIELRFGHHVQDLKFLKFRNTKYFGGEDRQMCPRYTILGQAKVQFTTSEQETCTLTAQEKHNGSFAYDVKLKNINCTK